MAEITTTLAAEPAGASCFAEISSFVFDFGFLTQSHGGNSMVLLTQGSTCWEEVRELFDATQDFINAQLELDLLQTGTGEDAATEAIAATAADAVEGTVAEGASGVTLILEQVNEYTDAYMMVAAMIWEPDQVLAGESVGMCVSPTNDTTAKASCWSLTREADGSFGANQSYLVSPEQFTADMKLEEQEGLGLVEVPLMFGSWFCTDPTELLGYEASTCARFLPKTANPDDTTYTANEEITIMNYMTAKQTGRIPPIDYVNGNQGLVAERRAFEEFSLTLESITGISLFGSAMNVASSGMAGLAFALFSISF